MGLDSTEASGQLTESAGRRAGRGPKPPPSPSNYRDRLGRLTTHLPFFLAVGASHRTFWPRKHKQKFSGSPRGSVYFLSQRGQSSSASSPVLARAWVPGAVVASCTQGWMAKGTQRHSSGHPPLRFLLTDTVERSYLLLWLSFSKISTNLTQNPVKDTLRKLQPISYINRRN